MGVGEHGRRGLGVGNEAEKHLDGADGADPEQEQR